MIVPSTEFTQDKIFFLQKHNLHSKKLIDFEEFTENFIDDEELEKISDKLIERNKNVYAKLAD